MINMSTFCESIFWFFRFKFFYLYGFRFRSFFGKERSEVTNVFSIIKILFYICQKIVSVSFLSSRIAVLLNLLPKVCRFSVGGIFTANVDAEN